jgi:hypothetical protein
MQINRTRKAADGTSEFFVRSPVSLHCPHLRIHIYISSSVVTAGLQPHQQSPSIPLHLPPSVPHLPIPLLSIPHFDAFFIAAAQIHYLGWKSRHDEWVRDNRLVEDNDAGRRLQKSMIANGGVVIDDDFAGVAGAKDGDESEEEELPGIKLAVPNTVRAQSHQPHRPWILFLAPFWSEKPLSSFWWNP